MSIEKMDLKTADVVDGNVARIAELFPNVVTEGRDENGQIVRVVDFDALRQELSDSIVEGAQERYRLDWPSKRKAMLAANTPITKTLRPVREESVDFDSTKNLFIEGDNLDALKLLQETYLGKVKMIYIDPPYNTGKDFIYKDNFTADKQDYLEDSGQIDEDGGKLVSNPESNGRYHSDWLSMMYPRLKLARNLLRDDGVIVIHIDENEYSNLEKILTEVFGEDNNLGTVVWDKRNPKGDVTGIAQQHELISFYCKNRTVFKVKVNFRRPKENAKAILNKAHRLVLTGGVTENTRSKFKDWLKQRTFPKGDKAYKFIDDNSDVYQSVSMAAPDRPETRSHRALIHPITNKLCPVPNKGWRCSNYTMDKFLQDGKILFGKDETTQPRRKYLLKDNPYENVYSLLYYGGSDDLLLSKLGVWFDTPKPVNVSKRLLQPIVNENDIVLDFFAGSATSAHATMQLNAEDGGNRKFIMVQLPEETDEKSEACKAGYKTIAEISKERIRRAGQKILASECHKGWNKDIGFRVLKIDSSNMNDVYYAPGDVDQKSLLDTVEHIKQDRTAEDLLFQVMLDWGVDLSLPIVRETIDGKTVYFVGDNDLAACFDMEISEDLVKAMAARKPLRAVFRDDGFGSDDIKINAGQLFKQMTDGHTDVKVI